MHKQGFRLCLMMALSVLVVSAAWANDAVDESKGLPMVEHAAMGTAVDANAGLGKALLHLSGLKGFSCRFSQVLTYAEGGKREYQGELAVWRPGKFRWHYSKPFEQLYLGNGQSFLLYEPDLMQVQMLDDLGDVEPVVIQLLDGRIGLEAVSVLSAEMLADGVLSTHARIGEDGHNVEIWLGVKHNRLLWVESRDVLNNRNRLLLLDIDETTPSSQQFEFVPPEGVDVIGAWK